MLRNVSHIKRLLLAMLIHLLYLPSVGQNLLDNMDAETGDMTGWSFTTPVNAVESQIQSTGVVSPAEGNYFFSFAVEAATHGLMNQRGTSGLTEGDTLILSGVLQTEGLGDVADVSLSIFNEDGNLLAVSQSLYESPNMKWVEFSRTLVVPEGAAYWEVDLTGGLNNGSYVNVFFDTLQLESHGDPPCECVVLHTN